MDKVVLFLIIIIFSAMGILIVSKQQGTNNQDVNVLTNFTTPTIMQQIPNNLPTNNNSSANTNNEQPIDTKKASISAVIKTSKGDIAITLFNQDAPNTVTNFINKAKSEFYNNLTFHRVEDWVVQGGDPKGDGTGGGVMQTELNNIPFEIGSIGIARGGDIRFSNDAQFFITKTKADWLDQRYTNFGIVTNGMNVVNKMEINDKILGITVEE